MNSCEKPNIKTHRNGQLRKRLQAVFEGYFDSANAEEIESKSGLILREAECAVYGAVMDHVNGNQKKGAEILGVESELLIEKLQKHFGTMRVGITKGLSPKVKNMKND